MFWRRRLDKGTLIAVVIAAIWCTGSVAPFASSLGGGSTTTALGGQDPALSAMPEGANPSADSGDAITALAPLLDYDAASLALSDNDPVSSWPNAGSLGSGWDLSNTGASTTKPTYVASDATLGVPVLSVSGDHLQTSGDPVLSQPYVELWVFKQDASSPSTSYFSCAEGSTLERFGTVTTNFFFASDGSFATATSRRDDEWRIAGVLFDGASSRLYATTDGYSGPQSQVGDANRLGLTVFNRDTFGSPLTANVARVAYLAAPNGLADLEAAVAAAETVYGAMPQ